MRPSLRPYLTSVLICSTLCGSAQNVPWTMLRLPDTGQSTDFTNTFGEDADFTINPPFFLVNGDGTVTDTITGLMWQQADGGEMTIGSAEAYVDTLTLAGYLDWRLPNAHEGFSIMDLAHNNPALDLTAFATTDAQYWWTSDRQANDSNKVWVTNAGGGIGNHPMNETISAGGVKRFHVRAVRDQSLPSVIPAQFVHLAFATAMDTLTGLTWQRGHCPDTLTWEEALHYADTLSIGGFSDWRLPNIKELRSISDVHLIGPSLDGGVFGNEGARKYWSSTTLQNQPLKAWYMNTQFGITTYDAKTLRHDVRCVRGGEEVSTAIEGTRSTSGNVCLIALPNPCHDRITLRFSTDGGPVNITVSDEQGRVVRKLQDRTLAPGDRTVEVDLEGLVPGVYCCRLSDSTRQQVARLMKVR